MKGGFCALSYVRALAATLALLAVRQRISAHACGTIAHYIAGPSLPLHPSWTRREALPQRLQGMLIRLLTLSGKIATWLHCF